MITNKLPNKLRKDVIARLMEHLQTDNYAELSRMLGCSSRQHLDNCFKRGNIPTNRIINYALKEGISLSWLFNQSQNVTITGSNYEEYNGAFHMLPKKKICRKLIEAERELDASDKEGL